MSDPRNKKKQNGACAGRRSSGGGARNNSKGACESGGGARSGGRVSESSVAQHDTSQSSALRRSTDEVRKIVEEEGRTARNLVTFNVPLEVDVNETSLTGSNRPSSLKTNTSANQVTDYNSADQSRSPRHRSQSGSRLSDGSRKSPLLARKRSEGLIGGGTAERQGNRVRQTNGGAGNQSENIGAVQGPRPSTPGGGQGMKGRDMRARYWAFLFDNLERAVDEIYKTCEADESVVECKEVLMMLDCCTRDFKSLIKRLELMKAYDRGTEEGIRPSSLAWEVRKTSSPGRPLISQTRPVIEPSPTVVRSLLFTTDPSESTTTSISSCNTNGANACMDVGTAACPTSELNANDATTATKANIAVTTKDAAAAGTPATKASATVAAATKSSTAAAGSAAAKSSPQKLSNATNTSSKSTVKKSEAVHTNRTPVGSSWADRVKGVRQCNVPREGHSITSAGRQCTARNSSSVNARGSQHVEPESEQTNSRNEEEDNEGWETVHRTGSKIRSRSGRSNQVKGHMRSRNSEGGSNASLNLDLGEKREGWQGFQRSMSAMTVNNGGSDSANLICRTAHSLISMSTYESRSSDRVSKSEDRSVESKASLDEEQRRSSEPSRGSKSEDSAMESKAAHSLIDEQGRNELSGEPASRTDVLDDSGHHEPMLPDETRQPVLDVNGNSVTADGGENFVVMSDVSLGDGQEGSLVNGSGVEQVSESTEVGPRSSVSDCDDEDEDDTYDIEMNNALRTVMSEEECLEDLLDLEQQKALESVMAVEQSYLLEIAREQQFEGIANDDSAGATVSTNDSEIGKASAEGEEPDGRVSTNASEALSDSHTDMDWDSLMRKYDEEAELRKSSTWGDIMEEAETRTPGRIVHVHEKLSSPSRKKSALETWKQQEEKQAKAQEQRERLLQDKSEHLRMLAKKVEEIQQWKAELLLQRKDAMERKLRNAEEKRQLMLQLKINKAHQEETKANEIAFINTLEAQNKKHDIMSKHLESEARLQDLQDERQRKHEEKAAKEAAVEERRRALEADRVSRLMEMQERRKQRETEFEQRQQEREKERLEAARAKEREREERLQAINKHQQQHIEELQKKIQQKQDESVRRHKEKLEAIQEKAICMTILRHSTEDHNDTPRLVPYERKKICTVCNVLIPSEVYLLSHLRGKKHQQAIADSSIGRELSKQDIENFNLRHISDAPLERSDERQQLSECSVERSKALKKRCKKLRTRMTLRGTEYEAGLAVKQLSCDSENKIKLVKVIKDLHKYSQVQAGSSGPWPQSKVSALDKSLGEIKRILDRLGSGDQTVMRVYGGLSALCKFLDVIRGSLSETIPIIPSKTIVLACNALLAACGRSIDNCTYLLYSNHISTLVDLLTHHLHLLVKDGSITAGQSLSSSGNGPSMFKLPQSPAATALTFTLAHVLNVLASHSPRQEPVRAQNGSVVEGGDSASINETRDSEKKLSRENSLRDGEREPSGRSEGTGDTRAARICDVVGYTVSVGVLDILSQYMDNIRSPLDSDSGGAEFIHSSISLVSSLIRLATTRRGAFGTDDSADLKADQQDDPTQIMLTLRSTQLLGVVSLLYGMLLHADAPTRGDTLPPSLPPHTVAVATISFLMLNHIAELDINLLQTALGEEGISLEYRHIASYLLWYCTHRLDSAQQLLHELVLSIGFFTVLNRDNQVIIQSGQPPTVLQQLCSLPFQYFSDSRLTQILFPTLISCCYQVNRNREILEQELSAVLLANYLEKKLLELQQSEEASCTSLSSSSTSLHTSSIADRTTGANRKSKTLNKEKSSGRLSLLSRFPLHVWSEAQQFFNSSPHSSSPAPSSIGSTSNSVNDLTSPCGSAHHLR